MKKSMKKILALVLVSVMVVGMLAGCGSKDKKTSSTKNGTETQTEGEKFTYRMTTSAPKTWNPCEWTMSNEGDIMGLTQMGFYDFVMNEAKDGYEIVPEMASAQPEDVTTEYAGNETYQVPADAKEGYVFKIALNKDACWEDGTPINADSYIYSMQQMLNPDMKNFRASSLFEGLLSISNAYGYYCGGVSYEDVYQDDGARDVSDDKMMITLTQPVFFFGASMESNYNDEAQVESFKDKDGNDLYEELRGMMDGAMYAPLKEEMKPILTQIATNFGDTAEDSWKEFCVEKKEIEKVDWEKVGLIKNDDYSITLVLNKPLSLFYLQYNLSSTWLVDEEMFEANKEQTGGITKTTYGTAADNYKSYGPYKVVSYQPDKSMTFAKNDKWYGYSDGNHKNQFQTTGIEYQFISKHTTELSLFQQGKLDIIALASDDMDKYGSSDYIYFTPQSYTYKYTFNTDIKAIKKGESKGVNHCIIAYKDFRHAVSLAIDRQAYVEKCTSCSDPGFGLVNYSYICNPDTGELYRNSDYAIQTLCEVYGATSEDDITGYDVKAASKLLQSAYDTCKKEGNIADSDKVEIDFHVYGSDDTYVRVVDFLQDSLNEAAQGTDLDGKIKVNLVQDEKYYDNLTAGVADLAITSWGGADMDPYSMLQCYTDPTYNLEYGFKPKSEKVTMTLDGKEITKTYYDWYKALCEGEYALSDLDVKNQILANAEKALLNEYHMVPIYYRTEAGLNSQRVITGSPTYVNSLVGFGGYRFLTYTMNDKEWDNYCKEQGNKLTY
ncbi:MAG: ABC transporter substrate-binding protein [Lachnospiraceae bacterium]